jgi:hypothetical protein
MKQILNNEFANLYFDPVSNALISVWKKPTTSESYRAFYTAVLENIGQYKAACYASDIYQQGLIDSESRHWLQNELFPKAYRAGLRKIATVTPGDVFSKFYIDSIQNGIMFNSLDMECNYFHDLITAQAWLLEKEIPA